MSDGPVVLVLSGGGARCAAQAGAVKAMEEWNVTPDHYVGTSMGAVIGACFASGLDYGQVVERLTTVTRRDVASLSPGVVLGMLAKSVLQERPLRETIEFLVPFYSERCVGASVRGERKFGSRVTLWVGGQVLRREAYHHRSSTASLLTALPLYRFTAHGSLDHRSL